MTEALLDNIYLILLLPLWIFLIIMVGRFFSVYVNKKIIYLLTLFASAFGALISGLALWKLPVDKVLITDFNFIKINDFIINAGLNVDKLSLIFTTTLFVVSFWIQLFATDYMKNETKNYRFFALLNLFNFSMAFLFLSPNLFQTYFFWELVGITSYLLIGFDYFSNIKSNASKKVLIINRIGDTSLLGAITICTYLLYFYAPNKNLATLSFLDMNTISTLIYAYASNPLFEIICLMFLLGIFVKSAQIPFYNWLQDAMEAKLPVSALLHSSTLVAGGIYLTLRLMPFLSLEVGLLKIVSYVGILTALICSLSACAQTNPKKVLAYSTSAQLGLIFYSIGVLNIKSALIFFIAHAFIKSSLFISLPNENEKWDFKKLLLFLINGLSLSGLLFSGMVAKELLALNLGLKTTIIFCLISFLTAFYIVRIALRIYSYYRMEKTKTSIIQLISLFGLLGMNILFYIYLHKFAQYKIAEPFISALTAWIVVYILFIKNAFWKVPILYPITLNGFYLDDFYSKFCVIMYKKLAQICNDIDNKVLSNYKILIEFSKFGVKTFNFVEEKIMNGSLKLIIKLFRSVSIKDSKAQTGNIQYYNTYALLIITIVLTALVLCYTTMLIFMGG